MYEFLNSKFWHIMEISTNQWHSNIHTTDLFSFRNITQPLQNKNKKSSQYNATTVYRETLYKQHKNGVPLMVTIFNIDLVRYLIRQHTALLKNHLLYHLLVFIMKAPLLIIHCLIQHSSCPIEPFLMRNGHYSR